jgi:glycosyltransferase involved in cell wall biosynthesis
MEHNRQWKPWKTSRSLSFKTVILNGTRIKQGEGYFYIQPELFGILRGIRPDIVINSEFNLNSLCGSLFGRLHKRKTLLWSEATCYSEHNRSHARRLYRRFLVKLNDGVVASGLDAKAHLLSLGVPEHSCFVAVDAVEDIKNRSDYPVLERRAMSIRSGFSGTILLYSGQLIERKGVANLLDTYKIVSSQHDVSLLIMGSGPLENRLKQKVQHERIKNVHFLGFMNETDKWVYYLASDIFVLPTRLDVWGLVVNEAMVCGLPVVCSKYAGAARDLVVDGENGRVVDPFDIAGFSLAIEQLATDKSKRQKMGSSSRTRIAEYSIEESAQGFLRAIDEVGSA